MNLALRFDQITDDFDILTLFEKIKEYIIVLTGDTIDKFLITEEIARISNKKHFHLFIGVINNINIKFDSFRKKLNKMISQGGYAGQPHNKSIQLCEDEKKYCVYILKDQEIITHNFDNISRYIELSEEITQNKKLSSTDKIYLFMKEHPPKDVDEFIIKIHELYIERWNRPAPQKFFILNQLQYYLYKEGYHEQLKHFIAQSGPINFIFRNASSSPQNETPDSEYEDTDTDRI